MKQPGIAERRARRARPRPARAISADRRSPRDLAAAREALRAVDPAGARSARARRADASAWARRSSSRIASAPAAELFERGPRPLGGARRRPRTSGVLDWWATALDRHAQTRPRADERDAVYARIVDRMEHGAGARSRLAPASYWLAAAARGTGDLERAWNAAHGRLGRGAASARDRGAALRADLDRLVIAGASSPSAPRAAAARSRSGSAGCAGDAELGVGSDCNGELAAQRLSASSAAQLALRFLPVLADPDVHGQRHRSAAPRLPSRSRTSAAVSSAASRGASNSSSSWTVRIIRARPPACATAAPRGRRSSPA